MISRHQEYPTLLRDLTAFLLLSLAGCSSEMALRITGADVLNTCQTPQSHPVVVCVYQLQQDGALRKADPATFWKDDTDALKDDLVGKKQQFMLAPGRSEKLTIELNKATHFVGIAADFCNPTNDQWKYIHALESGNSDLTITITDNRLVVRQD